MSDEVQVFIVDDDAAVLGSLGFLMESVGLAAERYDSAQAFLDAYRPEASGCLLLDIRMPGMGGLELQEHLKAKGVDLPVIFLTGHGDVPMAVRALKSGAYDFIEKPFNDQLLLDRVNEAIQYHQGLRSRQAGLDRVGALLASLTPREREVMEEVVAGLSNKEISHKLSVSTKTVEAHRARVMEKLQAGSLSELVRMVVEYRNLKEPA